MVVSSLHIKAEHLGHKAHGHGRSLMGLLVEDAHGLAAGKGPLAHVVHAHVVPHELLRCEVTALRGECLGAKGAQEPAVLCGKLDHGGLCGLEVDGGQSAH